MNKYPLQIKNENCAKALGRDLSISTKQSIEICNFIRNKKLQTAKEILRKVMDMKMAVPYKRFNGDIGHKKKIGPGRYPVSASTEILKLLEQADANAQFKGLNSSQLYITHISANKGAKSWRYGRRRRIKAKRTSITIIVEEKSEKKKKPAAKEAGKIEKPKSDAKPKENEKAVEIKEEAKAQEKKAIETAEKPKEEGKKEKAEDAPAKEEASAEEKAEKEPKAEEKTETTKGEKTEEVGSEAKEEPKTEDKK